MKALGKKIVAFALVFAMAMTMGFVVPENVMQVQAASKKVTMDDYSKTTFTYKPGMNVENEVIIRINGCTKASQIKKLKSSSKYVKVTAKNGYISAEYGKKAAKATITCTVKNVKLKTTINVKKYTNPLSSLKIGKTNLTSKFKTKDVYDNSKTFKKQKLTLKANKGWVIDSVSIKAGSGAAKMYTVNKSTFTKTISLNGKSGRVYIYIHNAKTGVSELLQIK